MKTENKKKNIVKMVTIDLERIREALPKTAKVLLINHKGKYPALKCTVTPSLTEEDFEMCKQWQREIIGSENINEFYTEESGHFWYVFLKRVPMEFLGVNDDDINSFNGVKCVENGELIKK